MGAQLSVQLLLDNSAFVRLASPALRERRSQEIADALEQRLIGVCLPFLLEAGYSARSADDHDELLRELMALPMLHIDTEVERRAVDAQRQLARAGHHRLPPVDLMIAALADRHRVGVLHYDSDYDVLATRTDLRFASIWLARRGSL
ncbi:PIN domain-containing protein [Mycobacterium shinjukuense]|uniref:Ribonuclease VapC n=1 Tax=Mycobacterium shinjukuense TaxID=398694 RepID=A0A7I7MSR0_9MYCO|nr:PIN domain-containing protein [Mycobacterium shinjukuense]MCV6986278.1 PIN domain-containing protein [Mycobacterium shinjukuense]BBX75225.1 ribonuclease VapC51 [Mycobacterium shinjukuense]